MATAVKTPSKTKTVSVTQIEALISRLSKKGVNTDAGKERATWRTAFRALINPEN